MRGNLFNIGVVASQTQGGGDPGILDEVKGAIYAGSLRKLRAGYFGPVVSLHQYASVNIDDFWADGSGGLINGAGQSPTQWLIFNGAAADAGLRVRILYNQAAGAVENISQTSQSLQPHIWKIGEPDYYRIGTNNRISLRWDPFDDALSYYGWAGYPDASVCVVQELLYTEPAHLLLSTNHSSYYAIVSAWASATANAAGNVHKNGVATGSTLRDQLYIDIQGNPYDCPGPPECAVPIAGNPVAAHTAQYTDVYMDGTQWQAAWNLNKYSSGSYFSNECKIAELIIYPDIIGASDITTIANEQMAYYGL